MLEPAPDTHPDAALLAMEGELERLLMRWEDLRAAWPKGRTAVERARLGRKVDDTLDRISDIHRQIVTTPARTLAGAAVQLRRLQTMLGSENLRVRQLLRSALAAHVWITR